jgi:hypothetical protein
MHTADPRPSQLFKAITATPMNLSETIRAAQIAADATIGAAYIQGVCTIFAGLLAVGGGCLAYRGAVQAAKRQVRLEEEKYRSRVAAYRARFKTILDDLDRLSYLAMQFATMTLQNYRLHGDTVPIGLQEVPVMADLSPLQWENHALLGTKVPDTIRRVSAAMERYQRVREEIVERGLQAGGVSKSSSVKAVDHAAGEIKYVPAAEVVVNFARDFRSAVQELKAAMEATELT